MSRTKRGSKPCGHEYWSKRAKGRFAFGSGSRRSPRTERQRIYTDKKLTHRAERRDAQGEISEAITENNNYLDHKQEVGYHPSEYNS